MVNNPLAVQETWVGKIPWRRAWPLQYLFLPGESYGQRSLAGYSPWGRKESDMTEQLSMHTDSAPGLLNQHLHLTSSLENRGAHKALRSTTPGHFNVHLPRL